MTLPFWAPAAALRPSLIRQIFDAAPPGALNMGLGMPDLPAPRIALDAAARALAQGDAPYTPNAGAPSLRRAVATLYGAWSREADVPDWVQPEGVVITAGVQEALFVALRALCAPGSALLIPDPGFPAYAMIAQLLGLRALPYRCAAAEGYAPTAAAIADALTDDTSAVILNSPGNPTGAVASAGELARITALLEARGVPFVSDEIYDRYCWRGPHASPGASSRQGVVISGLSKSANLMGWRLGWLLAPPGSAAPFIAVHQAVCTCASQLSQAAAEPVVLALAGQGDAAEIHQNLAVFAQRRDRALAALARHGLTAAPADGAFYLWVHVADRLAPGEDDLAFCLRLLREQALIAIPGQGFGDAGRGFVRLAYTCAALEDGIDRLAAALALPPGAPPHA